MEKKTWKIYTLWILLAEAVGLLSGWLSKNGMAVFMQTAAKPPFMPPPILFPIVWGILYTLMGFGAGRIYLTSSSPERSKGLNIYIVQLIVNFFWPLFFFNTKAFLFSFFWLVLLWLLVLRMIRVFSSVNPVAGFLQFPYLLWLSFAAYLNMGVWYLNR